ncbi:hypothetical protein FRX31_009523 [Thalictrum thalictroides]|uniref:Uncharacterized protein n=1 Tax=Thalictrum thalictroides TaxID=46969 RepID=A0A7J6WWE9_THATH|nr:hypothetical protein FRX31_009523 [Thalictrum thalictroides]
MLCLGWPTQIWHKAFTRASIFILSNAVPQEDTYRQPSLIAWNPPPVNFVKFNTDGANNAHGSAIVLLDPGTPLSPVLLYQAQ